MIALMIPSLETTALSDTKTVHAKGKKNGNKVMGVYLLCTKSGYYYISNIIDLSLWLLGFTASLITQIRFFLIYKI